MITGTEVFSHTYAGDKNQLLVRFSVGAG